MQSPPTDRRSDSISPGSPQYLGQLVWTGAVAVLLGIVVLQQATSPVSSISSSPSSVMTGNPLVDASISLTAAAQPWEQADESAPVPPQSGHSKTTQTRAPSSSRHTP